jgi:hypothetical protein
MLKALQKSSHTKNTNSLSLSCVAEMFLTKKWVTNNVSNFHEDDNICMVLNCRELSAAHLPNCKQTQSNTIDFCLFICLFVWNCLDRLTQILRKHVETCKACGCGNVTLWRHEEVSPHFFGRPAPPPSSTQCNLEVYCSLFMFTYQGICNYMYHV